IRLASHLQSLGLKPDFYNRLGTKTFALLNLDMNEVGGMLSADRWDVDHHLGFPYLSNQEWQLNLATGKIYNKLGEVKGIEKDCPWEKDEDFERVFEKEKGFSYRSVGNGCILFRHPTKGIFRLIPNFSSTGYFIQRKIPGFPDW